jgi:hypothetical protein
MGTYAGFFLPSILIPIFTLWAYYLSFMKYSFEALEQNEWADCASYYMISQFLSLDLTLNRWTNLLVLMAYPIIFHLAAFLSSLSKTGELTFTKCKRKKKKSLSTLSKDPFIVQEGPLPDGPAVVVVDDSTVVQSGNTSKDNVQADTNAFAQEMNGKDPEASGNTGASNTLQLA